MKFIPVSKLFPKLGDRVRVISDNINVRNMAKAIDRNIDINETYNVISTPNNDDVYVLSGKKAAKTHIGALEYVVDMSLMNPETDVDVYDIENDRFIEGRFTKRKGTAHAYDVHLIGMGGTISVTCDGTRSFPSGYIVVRKSI